MQVRTPFSASRFPRRSASGNLPSPAEPEQKSAARLAAEAAFADSRSAANEPAPTVTVRRSKGLGLQLPALPEPGEAEPEDAAASEAGKAPRVFRLVQSAAQAVTPAPLQAPAEPEPAATVEQPAGLPRRKRRVADEHRPGPVVQIFKAAELGAAGEPADDVTPLQLAALAKLLASVQPILEDIRRAQDLRF